MQTYIGCPVLLDFMNAIDPKVAMGDEDEWMDLRAKASNERPDDRHLRRCQILCIAYSVEEIAFACARIHMHQAARELRGAGRPIKQPSDFDPILAAIDGIYETIAAEVVQFKIMGNDLSQEQIRQKTMDAIGRSLSSCRSSITTLKASWSAPNEAIQLGRGFSLVCEHLSTPWSRRIVYVKQMLGDD